MKREMNLRVFASLRSCVAVAMLLCFVSIEVDAEWPTYHGGADLRGAAEFTLSDNPQLLWRANTGGEVYNTPVSDGHRIFVSAGKGRLAAFDLAGSEVWKKQFTRTNSAGESMSVRFDAPLVCGNGLVFASTMRGTLYALKSETGEEVWRYETGGILLGSPNLIPCGTDLDRKDAKTQREDNLRACASSRLKNRTVVVLDQSEGVLHAVDINTGKQLWKSESVQRCDGSPGIDGGRIVFGSCLAALHVYSTSGSHERDIEIGGDAQVADGVAMDGRFAFAGARDGRLVCADVERGEIVWSSQESQDQTFSTPAVTSNRVVYSSDNGWVYVVDRETGELIGSFETGGLPTSPVIANDAIAVSADGVLFLLSLESGKKLWSQEVSDEISSPALINGRMVVGADDGTLSVFGDANQKDSL